MQPAAPSPLIRADALGTMPLAFIGVPNPSSSLPNALSNPVTAFSWLEKQSLIVFGVSSSLPDPFAKDPLR